MGKSRFDARRVNATADRFRKFRDHRFGRGNFSQWLLVLRDRERSAKQAACAFNVRQLALERGKRGGMTIGGHADNIADTSRVGCSTEAQWPGQNGRYVTRTASQ
jgi:hypothetical protein